ncbi:MAG: hypothetical protein ACRESW_11780 [Nevskiales bacterium]
MTKLEPLQHMVNDWPAFWASGIDDQSDPIRLHTRTGRPLGSDAFIAKVERMTGRVLRPEKPGRKPMHLKFDEQQQTDVLK